VEPELKEYLSQSLPGYMIPTHIVRVEKMPLDFSGKLDRKALPEPAIIPGEAYVGPSDSLEEQLAVIWSEVLGLDIEVIGVDDDFFKIGGHSLKAAAVMSGIKNTFNMTLPLTEMFKTPTIKQLATCIRENDAQAFVVPDENLVLLRKHDSRNKHLFLVHDGSGEVEGYIEFCKYSDNKFNHWGLRFDKNETDVPGNTTIEEIASRYINAARKCQPRGPYYIAGWSLGGTIAFEMVNQLEQVGEEVAFAALIDSPPPGECTAESGPLFSPDSEKDFIKKYLPDKEIENKLQHMTGTREIWAFIIQYLESNRFDSEAVKKAIVEYEAHVVPNYHDAGIGQLVRYLNIGRTLHNARSQYTPTGKIHTRVFYFAAAQSKAIKKEHWSPYCEKPLKCVEIEGDHYSIFKRPYVTNFAAIFSRVINEINEVNNDY